MATQPARRPLAVLATTALALTGLTAVAPGAYASSVTAAVFTGGANTVTQGNTVFAKAGGALTLTVTTSSDTQCVDVAGSFTGHSTSAAAKASWTFTTTAGVGDGAQAVTVTASPSFNKNNNSCTGSSASGQGSYVLDNTGPVVTAALTPAANAAGWNNTNTTVSWTATDAGSGVGPAQPFQSDSVSSNGVVTKTAPAQADRLGNVGAVGAVTVRVDKAAPTIIAAQTKNPDGTTTVSFTCVDPDSGSGVASCLADGSATSARTVQPGVTVTGTAIDQAGNKATATSTAPAGDTTAPTLSGAPTTAPNAAGWYARDVKVHWTAADPESGIPTAPADTTISGEGKALTSSTTVTNGAKLSTTATSSPAVNIDRTAPTTSLSGTSNAWTNGDVTVSLAASDNLSDVARTEYTVDGGAARTGTSFILASEGDHTVTFSSTDKAGNTEAVQTANVRMDKTAPTISHAFTPLAYTDGVWTNHDVTVTFTCNDQGGSAVASCSDPVTKSSEGAGQDVVGTAKDNAGNSATDTAQVSIDKTLPTITGATSGSKNAAGWYNDDVTVTYTANDALSGVAVTPDSDVLGEGRGQASRATVTDGAGNSASTGVTGIDVDKTAPVLTAEVPSGWHTDDVAVAWSCTDALSGVATQPSNDTVTGEGDNLSSTANCTDVAGNVATRTVSGIKIDRTAPTTTASVAEPLASGWYGDAVKVTLDSEDNLSDAVTTYYSVDGKGTQTYDGAFSVSTEGQHSISFWSRDSAGNLEKPGAPLTLQIDRTPPVTTVVNPISPDRGWFVSSGIPVAFGAMDDGAGIKATYYTIDGGATQTYGEPFTADLSDGRHAITYWSVDLAGNAEERAATNTIAVNVDTEAPTISGKATPAANGFGWNNTDVDVTFSCADTGSGLQTGVAGCAGDTTLSNDGAEQTIQGDAVDVAGNRSVVDVSGISIDKTDPTLVGVLADANGAGWYKGDVTVKWVGDDALSGIDPATQPGDSTITGEGTDLGIGPVTIKDKAGNTSGPASVTGVRIDRTPPVISGAPTTSANDAGWYKDDVTVDFTCSDNLSGVASCPTSKLLKGDGAGQSVTSDAATDVAGNASAGRTVAGINIDGTAPTSTSNNTCTAVNDYCKGDTADVVLTATDQEGLSGVKEIHYMVDGGAAHVAAGASTTVSVPLSGSGAGTVTYFAVDKAGNVEKANSVALKWDSIAPTVSHSLSPVANADDWNNADTTVTFSAKDDDKGSGVASVTAPVTISTETAGQVVTGSAKDTAGNVGTDTLMVKLDKTAPTITGSVISGTKTASGWYNGPVTVGFTCSDALSGVAICPDPVVLSANGANTARGTVTDKAGNTATAQVDGISIDQEKPTLTTAGVNVQGGTYTLGSVPAAACTATDNFSGLASCTVTVTGGNASGVGTFTWTATAKDRAGNSSTVTGSYRVLYRFDGFQQPINDTAHQVGTSTSVFKAGSTVPAKLQLKKADGTVVQSAAAPVWLAPVKGSAMTAAVDESVYTASADSGTAYKYDATAQQYLYNWKTGSVAGSYWRIGVTLDDGQTYYVNIGLR